MMFRVAMVIRRATYALLALAMVTLLPVAEARATDLHNVLTDYVITSWNNKEGLPPGVVFALAQSPEGYLWVGSDAGLFRFDGERFVAWNAVSSTPLPDAGVRALWSARDGSLWIGFNGNAGVGHFANGQLRQYAEPDGLGSGPVVVVIEDHDGGLWAGNNTGFYHYEQDRFVRKSLGTSTPPTGVLSAFLDHSGSLFVGTSSELLKAVSPYQNFRSIHASDDVVRAIAEDGNGELWLSDSVSGFRVLDTTPAKTADADTPRGRGVRLLRDRRNNMWAATGGQGLWRINTGDNRIDRAKGLPYVERATSLTGLLGDGVYSLLEDRDGNVWAGTTEGLNRLTPRRITQMIDLGIVRGLDVTSSGLWVGTVDGLVEFTAAGSRLSEWRPSGARVTALYADPHETIWVATDRQLLRLVNGKAVPVALPMPLGQIETITSDGSDGIWLSDVERGLLHWQHGRLTPMTAVDVHQSRVLAAYTDRSGRVWFAMADGRVLRGRGDDRFETLGKADGLDAGIYDTFEEDARGTLWLGASAGVSRYADGRFSTVHASRAFPVNGVVSIAGDQEGSLWLGGSAGIVHISTAEVERAVTDAKYRPRFAIFERSDGIAGVPVALGNSRRVARAADGRLWFMTARGVTIMNPNELQQPHDPSPVRIEEVIADGRPLVAEPLMTLPAGTRRLEIHYTVINLTSALKTRFRSRLEGFDPDWIESDNRRQVYTNLPPRGYAFRVGTTDDDAGPGEPGQTDWQFSIAPMFYQSSWFYAVAALSLAAIFGLAWQVRLRKVRKEFAMLLGERARIGREIHDTLLQSLVGVSLQCDSIAADLDAHADIKRDKFVLMRKQVQEYIREAHEAIWDLRSGKLQDRDLGTALRESTEQAINGHDIRVQFEAAAPPSRPLPKIEEQVLKIGKEAVLNAVHHAHPHEIKVDLRYDDDVLTLRVSDDGCGFDPAFLNDDRHYGLMSMKERAAVVGGRLTVATAVAHGTLVTAVIPLTSRHA
jgi:signal transduction histidine kinase/streptogramin lyase